MIKKIPASALRVGMFVHDLNTGWMSHPFVLSQFTVNNADKVARVLGAGIQELYIDTERGVDVEDAPSRAEVDAAIMSEITEAVQTPLPARVDVASELARATRIKQQAATAIRNIMRDARLGRAIEVTQAEAVVDTINDSVLRNGGALIGLLGIKNKDEYTFLHSVSVCALMVAFARAQGYDDDTVRIAGLGALLHDTGKMMVPEAILNKPGRYTDDEFFVMKHHPEEGWQLLQSMSGLEDMVLDIALHHHERVDGTGYPHGLKGDEIATTTQMSSIVDVYDAITSNRCYHRGIPASEGLKKLWEWSSHHFDPRLVQAFIRTIGIYPVGSLVRLESGRLAIVMEQNEAQLVSPEVKVMYSTRANAYVRPERLELARSQDRIVGHEDPQRWGIDTTRFLSV
ncbi:MAG TPA: HD-GYP domain-containing protein [Chitinolyticbacter sp.]|nr:HD-GYP domain-containing protein [Chitinolyticbacter sp.]